MTTKEFFEEYNKAQDKAKCAERHIVKKYLPYSQKLDMAERIINASMYFPEKYFPCNALMFRE